MELWDGTAAVLLDGEQPVLLASEAELTRLARRQDKSLWIIARRPPLRGRSREARSQGASLPHQTAIAPTSAVCEVA